MSGSPSPSFDTSHLATRYRLLDAAARQMASHGPEGASLRAIAEDVGLTTGAIYRHFPGGKTELYSEILAFVAEGVRKSLERSFSGATDPLEAIVAGCAAAWDFFAAHPSFASLVVREGIGGGPSSPYFGKNEASMALFKLYLDSAAQQGRIAKVNAADFAFSTGAHCLSFHGAPAMRRALFTEDELPQARARFLAQVRAMLTPQKTP